MTPTSTSNPSCLQLQRYHRGFYFSLYKNTFSAPALTVAPHPGSGQLTSHALLHGLSRLSPFSPPLSLQPSWFLLHRLLPRWLHGLWHPLPPQSSPRTAVRAVFRNSCSDTCLLRNLQQHPKAQRIKPTLLHLALL